MTDPGSDAIKLYDQVAREYHQKFAPMRIYDHTYDALLSRLKEGASVIDIGCGPGIISRYLKSRKPSLKIHCTDGSPQMIEIAEQVLEARFTVADCRNFDTDEKYDAVVCGFIIPYLSPDENAAFIVNCSRMLNPGGTLYLSFQEASHTESAVQTSSDGKRSVFMNYYLEADICGWLEDAGLEKTATFRIPYGDMPDVAIHAVILAVKDERAAIY